MALHTGNGYVFRQLCPFSFTFTLPSSTDSCVIGWDIEIQVLYDWEEKMPIKSFTIFHFFFILRVSSIHTLSFSLPFHHCIRIALNTSSSLFTPTENMFCVYWSYWLNLLLPWNATNQDFDVILSILITEKQICKSWSSEWWPVVKKFKNYTCSLPYLHSNMAY